MGTQENFKVLLCEAGSPYRTQVNTCLELTVPLITHSGTGEFILTQTGAPETKTWLNCP